MQVGRFEVIRQLGGGGMSEALLARAASGRMVVLKRPRQADAELMARLRDEGRLGAKLFHANLVETLEAFEHEGLPVVALGFVDGPTVDELRKARPLPPAAVARLGCQIAEALGCIHGALGDDGRPLRAVHRDVSPRNIIVAPSGDAVLIDLGIARFDELRGARTETGMVLGTLRYMAPELIDGAAASPASDFYSLGCVLVEAATGLNCFSGPPSEVAVAIVTKGPLALPAASTIEPRLKALLARMCARDSKQRFQEAHELSRALRELEGALGGGQEALAARVTERAQALEGAGGPFTEAAAGAPRAVTGVNPEPTMSGAATLPMPMVAEASATTGGAAPEGASAGTLQLSMLSSGVAPIGARAPAAAVSAAVPAAPASLPASLPAPPRAPARAAAPSFAPPRVDASLELAVEPRSARTQAPAADYSQAPTHRPSYQQDSKILGTALKLIAVLALLAGAFGYWRYSTDEEARQKAEGVKRRLERDAVLLQDAMKDTAEPCESRSDAFWVYPDGKGTDVVVDSATKVPKPLRAKARCVLPAR